MISIELKFIDFFLLKQKCQKFKFLGENQWQLQTLFMIDKKNFSRISNEYDSLGINRVYICLPLESHSNVIILRYGSLNSPFERSKNKSVWLQTKIESRKWNDSSRDQLLMSL